MITKETIITGTDYRVCTCSWIGMDGASLYAVTSEQRADAAMCDPGELKPGGWRETDMQIFKSSADADKAHGARVETITRRGY